MCSKFERNRNMGRLFLSDLNVFVILCEEEETREENRQYLRSNISRTAEAISFNFDMLSSVYVRQKIYKFGRNQHSSFGDTEG